MMQADKEKVSALLKTARGQIDGILKMIEQDRYCLDIYHQITATQCVLKKANKEIMTAHMYHCVKEAFEHGDPEEKNSGTDRFNGEILPLAPIIVTRTSR